MQPSPLLKPHVNKIPDQLVNFNGRLVPLALLPVSPLNRSFLYGDSLFETIVLRNGKLQRLALHIKRLKKGASVLQLEWDNRITEKNVAPVLYELAVQNRIEGDARFRWQMWRGDGGKFLPDSHESNRQLPALYSGGFRGQIQES